MEAIRRRLGFGYGEPMPLGSTTRNVSDEWITQIKPKTEVKVEQPSSSVDATPSMSSRHWSIEGLLKQSRTFTQVRRISALLPEPQLLRIFEEHETSGKPLIIEDWHKHPKWPKDLFNMDWLLDHCGDHTWDIRDVRSGTDVEVTLANFIEWSRARAASGVPHGGPLLYGKDAPCPPEWRDWVNSSDLLPSVLCTHGPTDLFQNLTKTEEVESLMCYLGIGDTFTPCHKDLCASAGQNIMCYTEDDGSSFWFMTESESAPSAAEYFQKHIGQELDWEAHTVTVDEFANAPFKVYIAEQKLGDLVLVPPRSCHQVVNRGGLTVKTSWSRMTIQSLMIAFHHELPIYRRVCRPEQYRVKHIIYRSLLRYTSQIRQLQSHLQHGFDSPPSSRERLPSLEAYAMTGTHSACASSSLTAGAGLPITSRRGGQLSRLASDLCQLIDLFDSVLYEEYGPAHGELPMILSSTSASSDPANLPAIFAFRTPTKRQPKLSLKASSSKAHDTGGPQSYDARNFACDFCGADIFQSFFECRQCRPIHYTGFDDEDEEEQWQYGDGLLICSHCYAEGRTCRCQISMYAVQYRPFGDLLRDRNEAVRVLQALADFHIGSKSRHSILMEHEITTSTHLNVFAAGCRLLSLRKQDSKSQTRKCRCGTVGPVFEVIYCVACHTSKCFKELLRAGLHSAEIILRGSGGGTAFHDLHRETRLDFRGSIRELEAAERQGEVIKHKDRLVFVAQRYSTCRPMNPRNVRQGWYDELTTYGVDASIATDPSYNQDVQPSATLKGEARSEDSRDTLTRESDSPLTVITSSNNSPRPQGSRRSAPRLIAEVVLDERKRTHFQSRGASLSQDISRSMSGSRDRPSGDDKNVEQDYAVSLAHAMNAANDRAIVGSSSCHVRGGRVYSSSLENSPELVENLLDDVDERPSPPKKRRLKKDADLRRQGFSTSLPTNTSTLKTSSTTQNASIGVVRGVRGGPPGKRTLRHASASDATKSAEPVSAAGPSTSSNATLPGPASLPANIDSIAQMQDIFFKLLAAQQPGMRTTFSGDAQLFRGSIAEHEDPTTRRIAEMERSFNKKIEELGKLVATKNQEQDAGASKARQQYEILAPKVATLEACVKMLEEKGRKQTYDIEQLRAAKDQAEARANELDNKMKTWVEDFHRKYEVMKIFVDLKPSQQTTMLVDPKSLPAAQSLIYTHGTATAMPITMGNGAPGSPPKQQNQAGQYCSPSHSHPHTHTNGFRRGTYQRGRGGRYGNLGYRHSYHAQGSEPWNNQDSPPTYQTPRRRPDDEANHASTSYASHNGFAQSGFTYDGHSQGRPHGHHQENKPYYKPTERPRDGNHNPEGHGHRSHTRWDYSMPEHSRAEQSRRTPYEREDTSYSSGQTDAAPSKSRSPSRERSVSLDRSPGPSRDRSPMRGRTPSRKGTK